MTSLSKRLNIVAASVVVSLGIAIPAQAMAESPSIVTGVGEGGGSGGSGSLQPFNLQGVIQNQGYQSQGYGRRVKIRGYSRLANSSNNRVDADYINVRCNAYDTLGGYTTDYDSENGGSLVDVNFASNFVYGVGDARKIRVNCTHYATKAGEVYQTTSELEIVIPG
ncbi:hypothetical protein [Actinokineospora sp. NBRC 105648]|uniref:hypothetical protein n=1 Tax=Actinokineospora sp. NBRC 105648 TaxID=3032206 RepID=UPI0024A02407|nr:hypothetical protein [Actinokineospora sp. NBRC 105648]GLZ42837.1 hypothetical protein Acsp05_64610 [Actinokineospora sp. NBRC 105648]